MTKTEHLRRLLDEREIEHRDTTPDLLEDWKNWVTEVRLSDGRWFRIIERQTGDFTFEAFGLTPEQVITAMLGDKNSDQMSTTDELKSCPFCGATDDVMTTRDFWAGAIPAEAECANQVGCTVCDIWTPVFDTEEQAIAAWNRRAYD